MKSLIPILILLTTFILNTFQHPSRKYQKLYIKNYNQIQQSKEKYHHSLKQYNPDLREISQQSYNNQKLHSLKMHKKVNFYETPLKNIESLEYDIQIKLGSNEEPFNVTLDSGSSDLWVYADQCKGCDSHLKTYNCKTQSNTCTETQVALQITYDDGPIIGNIAFDSLQLDVNIENGNQYLENQNILLRNQSFLYVFQGEAAMSTTPGLLGIGPPLLSVNPFPQLIQNLKNNDIIDHRIFSLYFSDEDDSTSSRIIFGGFDPKYIAEGEKILYADQILSEMYMINIQGLKIQGKLFPFGEALIDSGTSCMTFPETFVENIFKAFQERNIQCIYDIEPYAPDYSMLNCKGNLNSFPDLSFTIQNQELKFRPQDYIYNCYALPGDTDVFCLTKIEKSQIDSFIILGDAFLTSFYTIFDLDNRKIGLAHSINGNKKLEDLVNYEEEIHKLIKQNHNLVKPYHSKLWLNDLFIFSFVVFFIVIIVLKVQTGLKEKLKEKFQKQLNPKTLKYEVDSYFPTKYFDKSKQNNLNVTYTHNIQQQIQSNNNNKYENL